jgi:hypothetical protein
VERKFGVFIERSGCFIKHKKDGSRQQRQRNRPPLLFTFRQAFVPPITRLQATDKGA